MKNFVLWLPYVVRVSIETYKEGAIIDIEEAKYIVGYKLQLLFSDGKAPIVDFEPFLRNSLNPQIKKYLAFDKFLNFSVEYGDLFWNDYDLCFPIADLYEGRI